MEEARQLPCSNFVFEGTQVGQVPLSIESNAMLQAGGGEVKLTAMAKYFHSFA
jgi:hypothetical protein